MEKIDNVLLIGSSGQIGSNIKNNLKKISKKTYCLLRKDFNLENLKSIDKVLNKIKPKLIINAAAYTKVDDAEKNKKICYKINALAPKKIAQWCHKNNAFLVHYSTDYIFSGENNNNAWKENDKPKPINFYGQSKLEGEKLILSSKCDYLILRVNWLYADRGENFPKKIIKKILKEKKIFVVNDQIGTPNHAEFISTMTIKILKKIITKPKTNPKILNVSARGKISYYHFAKKIHKELGPNYKNCKLTPICTKDLTKSVANYTKMKRPLNSKFNINALEKFLKNKMPDWEIIFKKKIGIIIKNYK